MELAFAGLHQLCVPVLSNLERLPDPQRGALNTAFGLVAGEAVDRFIVGLAVLGLLSEVAEQQPLLCVVDDAQWLDRVPRAGTRVRRVRRSSRTRLRWSSPCASRPTKRRSSGLPELVVPGLRDADARALLDSVVPGRLEARVRDRIVAETRGNPLALLELPRGLTAAELAGGFGRPDAQPLSSRIEQNFRRQMLTLPAETQRLARDRRRRTGRRRRRCCGGGRAARDRTGCGAAGRGGGTDRARCAGALPPSAGPRRGYRSATGPDRRDAHRALAEVTDPAIDPARRAVASRPGRDDARRGSGGRARAFGRRGREPRRPGRGRRVPGAGDRAHARPASARAAAIAAAQAKLDAAAPDDATQLLATAETCPLDELQRAQVVRLRAQIAFTRSRGNDAPPLMLDAARRTRAAGPRARA